jgi:cytoskeletal protein RodZ
VASVGEALRSERLRQGLQVSEIAAAIKIRPDYIEAIEAGNFVLLPAGAYRKNFVRQYAHALGLNEETTLASFQEEHQEPLVALPAPVPSRPHHGLRMAGALAALSASFFIYHKVVSETSSESHVAKPAGSPHLADVTPPHPEPAVTRPAVSQGEAARTDPRSDSGRPVRVALSATEKVWISVRCDGAEAFTGTLEGAEVKRFEASSQMTLLVGNAGGLSIELNERPVAPLGAHGQIELVEFTPGGVRRVPRRPVVKPGGDEIPQA